MSTLTVSPAYGRDYKSARAARAAWDADQDFEIESVFESGRYVNRADLTADGRYSHVSIRYNRLRSVTLVEVK